jgi:hypothetical protein
MKILLAISAVALTASASAARAVDINLQDYKCSEFIADVKDPADGGKLLKSLMMISWSTGYAAAYQSKSVRADPAALRLIAATLGDLCAKSPNRNATQVLVEAVTEFGKAEIRVATATSGPKLSGERQGSFSTYDNYDMSGGDFQRLLNVDQKACVSACTKDSKCEAYSYDKWEKRCYLKNELSSLVLSPDSIAGVRVNLNQPAASEAKLRLDPRSAKRFSGQQNRVIANSSAPSCATACEQEAQCLGYTFLKRETNCQLFESITSFVADQNASSGLKTQSPP